MNSMKRWRLTVLAFLATILAAPSICHAHEVPSVYYPFVLPFVGPAASLPAFVAIGIQALILQYMISNKKWLAILWRSGVVFRGSKAGESIGFVVLLTAPWAIWESVFPLLLFAFGLVMNAALLWAVFRKERPSAARILGTAGLVSLTSYVVLLLSTVGMLQIGWIR